MNNIKFLILLVIFLTGCLIYGPYPREDKYNYAVRSIPNYNEAVYVLYGVFWKNVFVEDPAYSVPREGTICSLFIMNDKLLFAVYDKKKLIYRTLDFTSLTDIASTSLNKSMTGIRRTFCYQKNDGRYNSFGIIYSYKTDGTEIETDTALDFIFNKIKKQQ